jgi:Rieske Fe-S protein
MKKSQPNQPHWKTDFSVDWEQTSFITRREFTRFLALGSAGMAAGNFVMAGMAGLRHESTRPRIELTQVDSIKPRGYFRFEYPSAGHFALLLRHEDGSLSAFSQRCPHLGCSVFYSPELEKLECPCHEGFFDPKSGDVLSGPPQRGLAKIELEIIDGTIFAVGGGEA